MQQTYLLCCPCHFGLERTLRFEISKIGGTDIAAQDGRVLFRGDTETIAKANLCLSTAERVLIQLGQFKAFNFEELFQGVRALPLEQWIGKDDAFPVKGHALDSKLHSVSVHHQKGSCRTAEVCLSHQLVHRIRCGASTAVYHPKKHCHHLPGHHRHRTAQAWLSKELQRCPYQGDACGRYC